MPVPQWSSGGGKAAKKDPNKLNLGRVLKRVPRFTYLLVLLGDIVYLPIFVCTALGWGHCKGGGKGGRGALA